LLDRADDRGRPWGCFRELAIARDGSRFAESQFDETHALVGIPREPAVRKTQDMPSLGCQFRLAGEKVLELSSRHAGTSAGLVIPIHLERDVDERLLNNGEVHSVVVPLGVTKSLLGPNEAR
jgi:hypothetical protein